MHRRDAAQHKFDHGNRRFPISLIPLGLAGSGTNAAPIALLLVRQQPIYVKREVSVKKDEVEI